jgi:hypothetical protein
MLLAGFAAAIFILCAAGFVVRAGMHVSVAACRFARTVPHL